MTLHSTDFISSLFAERGRIRAEQGLLSKRMTAIDAVLLAYSDAAQEPIPEAPTPLPEGGGQRAPTIETRPAEAKTSEQEPSSDGSGETQDRCESVSPPIPDISITISAKTRAAQPGSEAAVDDADAAPTGEAQAPDASPAPIPVYSRAGNVGTWVRGSEKAADAPPAGEALASPAPITKREQVRNTYEDHPDWTAAQVAEHLGLTRGSVSGHASLLGITFAPAKPTTPQPPAVVKAERIRLTHEQHPAWTARMIANELGEKESTVTDVLSGARAGALNAPEFAGKAELVGHYSEVAKRLGKV